MKIIAHRGWSQGRGENTMESFRKALQEKRVEGVELDIWENESGEIVVTHNKPIPGSQTLLLTEVLDLFHKTGHEILIECKAFSTSIFDKMSMIIKNHGLEQKILLFAFPEIAKDFPWLNRRNIRLGIISKYPWNIKNDIRQYDPDTVLFGWNTKLERLQFKIWWTLFGSIPKLIEKYNKTKFIAGVMFNENDLKWLDKQGLYASTADKPFVWK